jgi:hypothetical protein
MAPRRLAVMAALEHAGWRWGAALRLVARQTRVPLPGRALSGGLRVAF